MRYRLFIDSIFSRNLLEAAPFPNINDKGPMMTSVFNPDSYSTSVMGIGKEWECQAFADGQITYRWFKNDVVSKKNSFLNCTLCIFIVFS